MTKSTVGLEQLRSRVLPRLRRAYDLLHDHRPEEALQLLLSARTEAAAANVHSAWIWWATSLASDQLGHFDAALTEITAALEIDPLAPNFLQARDLIVSHLRSSLLDESCPIEPRRYRCLYSQLVNAGAADLDTHLAMAKHLIKAGEMDEALNLLAAIAHLYPNASDCWRLTAFAARKVGNEELACEAESNAEHLSGGSAVVVPLRPAVEE